MLDDERKQQSDDILLLQIALKQLKGQFQEVQETNKIFEEKLNRQESILNELLQEKGNTKTLPQVNKVS